MNIPDILMAHTVSIAVYEGETANGPKYRPSITAPAYVEDKRRVMPGPSGSQVESSTAVWLQLGVNGGDIPPQSHVEHVCCAPGVERVVVACARYELDDATPNHLEVALQ